jgi:hypothetical protein
VLAEAAIATMAFFMLVFAVIEGSGLTSDYLGVADVVRAGSRTATVNGSDSLTDFYTLKTMKREGRALKTSGFEFVVIYKANGFGDPPNAVCKAGIAVLTQCNVYTATDVARPQSSFGCLNPGALDSFWCPSSRKTAQDGLNGPPDYVGIYVKFNHPMYTRFFGASKTITDFAVLRLEPRRE